MVHVPLSRAWDPNQNDWQWLYPTIQMQAIQQQPKQGEQHQSFVLQQVRIYFHRTQLTNIASRPCFISASRYSQSCSLFFARPRGSKPTLPAKSQSIKGPGHLKKGMDCDITTLGLFEGPGSTESSSIIVSRPSGAEKDIFKDKSEPVELRDDVKASTLLLSINTQRDNLIIVENIVSVGNAGNGLVLNIICQVDCTYCTLTLRYNKQEKDGKEQQTGVMCQEEEGFFSNHFLMNPTVKAGV